MCHEISDVFLQSTKKIVFMSQLHLVKNIGMISRALGATKEQLSICFTNQTINH